MFKIAKRKKITDEEFEILCKHGNITDNVGNNVLHYYLLYNDRFDETKADKLKLTCSLQQELTADNTVYGNSRYILTILMSQKMEDFQRDVKLRWMKKYISEITFEKELFYKVLRKLYCVVYYSDGITDHSVPKIRDPLTDLEIEFLHYGVTNNLINVNGKNGHNSQTIHPISICEKLSHYEYLMKTFSFKGYIFEIPSVAFALPRESKLLMTMISMSVSPHDYKSRVSYLLHYQPYIFYKEFRIHHPSTSTVIPDFKKFGYSQLAVENLETMIIDGHLSHQDIDNIPDETIRGILHGTDNGIWVKIVEYGDDSFLIFHSDKRCGNVHTWKTFKTEEGKSIRSKDKNLTIAQLQKEYEKTFGPLPSPEAVKGLRNLWKHMATTKSYANEDEIKKCLKDQRLPWREQITTQSSCTIQEPSHQQQVATQ